MLHNVALLREEAQAGRREETRLNDSVAFFSLAASQETARALLPIPARLGRTGPLAEKLMPDVSRFQSMKFGGTRAPHEPNEPTRKCDHQSPGH
jgi:hypothetical protein